MVDFCEKHNEEQIISASIGFIIPPKKIVAQLEEDKLR
jgi:hypothetical protein